MGFNTPFKMWKRYASFEGGIAAPCVVYWPRGIADRSGIRAQYCHAIDLMPTLLECAGTRMPDTVRGYTQKPIEGISLAYTFEDAYAVGHRDLQFYSMLGTRGIWSRGWKAVTTHPPLAGWGNFSRDTWELYNTDDDRTERFDLAAQHPAKLEELKNLWFVCAGRYGALPLDDRNMAEILEAPRPALVGARKRYVYYPNISGVPEAAAVSIRGRSYTVAAHVEIVSAEAAGVLFAMGGRFGGHALYVKDRRLRYVYNFVGIEDQLIDRARMCRSATPCSWPRSRRRARRARARRPASCACSSTAVSSASGPSARSPAASRSQARGSTSDATAATPSPRTIPGIGHGPLPAARSAGSRWT
jgi:arylsulfatase